MGNSLWNSYDDFMITGVASFEPKTHLENNVKSRNGLEGTVSILLIIHIIWHN